MKEHEMKWNEKWFIAYSSSMLDCTRNIKTRTYNAESQYTCYSQYTV